MNNKEQTLKTLEIIRQYVNDVTGLTLEMPRALNLIEQTLDKSIDWGDKDAAQKAFFDFLEKRQGEVFQ